MAAVLAANTAWAGPAALQGTVTEVYNGQTLQITQPGGAAVEVRLAGVDVPEPCQNWGPDARDALKAWVMGRQVTVTPSGRAEKGRIAATVTLEGANINSRMVEEGHAWSVRERYDRGPYVKQERMAHSLLRGLHAAGGALRPADFRRQHGPC